ncbi:MAG: BREX system P-loop protein BrxC [Candidatus Bathyarchaeota archaeon]|nr:MAG: BREX system P-loop protein BrxC [Candidatus Bathyarchaeota archaeon]
MINQEIYQRDPSALKLVNEGVANVNDEKTSQAMAILRYELETFVCEGEYERGLEHILETYLMNIEQAQQPGVWISGFYGSGKSHLVKMLRALWIDTAFEHGTTARSIADLPQNILDLLKELNTQAKRYGGLHAASGTLGASASESVRLALLRIIFKSVDLPEQYPVARFVMWLKKEGIYDAVRKDLEQNGFKWDEELANFYVAEELPKSLVKIKPNLFPSPAICREILRNQYPHDSARDISIDDMVKAIRKALGTDGKFPLTLIALDEVQQFIGDSIQRSLDVQQVVEACCAKFGGKLMFIGTGQTAVTGTSNLRKLEGRFTIRVELSDTDVDAVIRKVILAKKPDAISSINKILQTNIGEISRHLSGTTLAHRQIDNEYFVQDYPILPVRRRFWENTLRVLDQTGTASQLRNQLSMVHKVIQTNLTEELGNVVPADYLYFDSADKMLQARILPRNVHEKTMSWRNSPDEDKRLMARACGLIFLINKLASKNKEIGIKANVDTLADLMVENLPEGSSTLRSKLPTILNNCELLMKVGDEYRIQTQESTAWIDEFQSQKGILANESHRIEAERDDRIRLHFAKLVKTLSMTQGKSKVTREISPLFNVQLPADHDKKVYVWVRDGWNIDDASVLADARQARDQSPTIFVFVPKRSADDLRQNIIDYKAANATLEKRGIPNTAEGIDAHAAMETTYRTADSRIEELLGEIFSGARVYQGGGNEILGNSLQDIILEAAEKSFKRLYPQFDTADHTGWGTVYTRAKAGAPDALKAVNYTGEPAKHPVCKSILGFIAGGKRGTEIRTNFEEAPYGWSRDALDGSIQVLLTNGLILAQDDRGQRIDPRELERKAIGKVMFKVESTTVSTEQRLQIRKLFQIVGIPTKPEEELKNTPQFLDKMQELAENAGGEAPKPVQPDTSSLDEIRRTAGNEQLIAIYNRHEELAQNFNEWSKLAANIEKNWKLWLNLQELLEYADTVKEGDEALQQAQVIEDQRLLLAEPNLIIPLIKPLEEILRKKLTESNQGYISELKHKTELLERDPTWQELTEDTQEEIKEKCDINPIEPISVGTRSELIKELDERSIQSWNERTYALTERFARAREMAAKELEPKTQIVDIPRQTIKTEEDIESWLQEVKKLLKAALKKGPIIIR